MKRFFVLLFTLFTFSFSFADYNKLNVPDSTAIRKSIEDSWFKATIDSVRENATEVRKNSIGEEFQVRLEEQDDTFAIVIAPLRMMEMDVYTEKGIEKRTMAMYPADARGGFVLLRSTKTGKPISIRIYFAADSDVYVQFMPDKNTTLADFVISGLYAARAVPVGIAFDRLYTASFQTILRMTEKTLPWKYAEIVPSDYGVSLKMVATIRKNLGRVIYFPDAAYDEDFKPVKISDGKPREITDEEKNSNKITLSEAGFVKWIIDGLVEPLAGSGIRLAPLTQPTVEYKPQGLKGSSIEKDSTTFTLDWARNLATAWLSVQKHQNYKPSQSGLDVKKEPFAAVETEHGISQVSGHTKDTGYKATQLRSLLYTLAIEEKSYFYIGAIRRADPKQKKNETLSYIFDKCALFFPYFSEDGRFDCIVFQNGVEISLKQFIENNNGNFVHLSRCLTSERFFLQ